MCWGDYENVHSESFYFTKMLKTPNFLFHVLSGRNINKYSAFKSVQHKIFSGKRLFFIALSDKIFQVMIMMMH